MTRVIAEHRCGPHAGILAAALAKRRCRREKARRRELLQELDDRMLRDIGLTRTDVLFRTLGEDAAAPGRAVIPPKQRALAQRPLMSRTVLTLMIITLSIALTVWAA